MPVQQLMVANCPRCGKVFQKNLRNQCTDCSSSMDSMLTSSLEFLRKNHRSTNIQFSEATGVSQEQVHTWIKEGKLLLSDYPNLNYPCASCSKPIRGQKLCPDCAYRINRDIRELKEKDRSFQPLLREKQTVSAGGFQIRGRLSGV
ncbi:flagellar protein [Paenibacillus sp. V4I5]|uniref:flagellar protein n=1 Tax=Paenibacillus sp. V4I5 TaxID=3042306 RepID=UPI0027941467|nr:flagellar protein [Paenibacillus sp. V4I5]MDQ0915738.1 DNA-directed RNA polymerase subunit RPC12/RpoP [Paenibacillus sp. V4I5]